MFMTAFGDSYIKQITETNILTGTHFDLTNASYHGGTTMSSGALPKWDILDRHYMIKRCSVDGFGNNLTDSANEELVYLFCNELGIKCAKYRSIVIKYFDIELRRTVECPAVVTEIFEGELLHYRDLREQFRLGSINDELIDLADQFNVMPDLNDLFFIDFIFNQQDRHSKNIGLLDDGLSPLFDSGACLFYNVFDSALTDEYVFNIPRHKSFGKRLDEPLLFSLKYIYSYFSFSFDESRLNNIVDSVTKAMAVQYSEQRLKFIQKLLKGRIENVGQILAQV